MHLNTIPPTTGLRIMKIIFTVFTAQKLEDLKIKLPCTFLPRG